jgi:glycosyltransferase involved in cell wall biosynthesis
VSCISVVVSTYEWPEALDIVLRAFAEQTDQEFEIVVADDGSGGRTADVVASWKETFGERLDHVWHEDAGYRRARVVGLAALKTRGNHLVFMDGDCIPRMGFVEGVRRAALPGWFLSTKRIKLDEPFSERVLARELPIWRWSMATWMIRGRTEVRRPGFFLSLRDRRRPWKPEQPDFAPPDNAYGFFCAMARADFERVNGWDARFVGWGSDDNDLVVRLRRIGLRCGWPGPSTTLLHVWHPEGRDPIDPGFIANEQLLHETLASDRVEAVEGLRELAAQMSANRVTASSSSSDPVKR